jgi:flagellar biosynthesis GTPase FlhF
MGRFSALMLALLLGATTAAALSSCGGGSDAKLLPGTTADQIESNLDQVKSLVESGDCVGAEDAVASVSAEVEELNVAAKLKGALEEGTEKLSEVVGRCEEEAGEAEETEPSAAADVEAEEEESEQEDLKAEEKAEKAQEKAEKQEQKEEEKTEAPEVEESEGALPPQAEGKGKGHEEVVPPPAAEQPSEGSESGGVSPGVGVE